jgi:hypothetical protein
MSKMLNRGGAVLVAPAVWLALAAVGSRPAAAQQFTFAIAPDWNVTVHGTSSVGFPIYPSQTAPNAAVTAGTFPSGAGAPLSFLSETVYQLTFEYTGPPPARTIYVPIHLDAGAGFGAYNYSHAPTVTTGARIAIDSFGDPTVTNRDDFFDTGPGGPVYKMGTGANVSGIRTYKIDTSPFYIGLLTKSGWTSQWGPGDVGTSYGAAQRLEVRPPLSSPGGGAIGPLPGQEADPLDLSTGPDGDLRLLWSAGPSRPGAVMWIHPGGSVLGAATTIDSPGDVAGASPIRIATANDNSTRVLLTTGSDGFFLNQLGAVPALAAVSPLWSGGARDLGTRSDRATAVLRPLNGLVAISPSFGFATYPPGSYPGLTIAGHPFSATDTTAYLLVTNNATQGAHHIASVTPAGATTDSPPDGPYFTGSTFWAPADVAVGPDGNDYVLFVNGAGFTWRLYSPSARAWDHGPVIVSKPGWRAIAVAVGAANGAPVVYALLQNTDNSAPHQALVYKYDTRAATTAYLGPFVD